MARSSRISEVAPAVAGPGEDAAARDGGMRIEVVPIDSVTLDPANVRKHDTRSIEVIKGSLLRFNQQKPIVVDSRGIVRAGNGTLIAARDLGWTEIRIVRSDLTGVELAAYSLVDNRSAELSEWDFEGLGETIRALQAEEFDISLLGWQDHELEPILAADWAPPSVQELPEGDGCPGDDTGGDDTPEVIRLTPAQRLVVDRAIAAVREAEGDDTLTEGRCVELIAERYLEVMG